MSIVDPSGAWMAASPRQRCGASALERRGAGAAGPVDRSAFREHALDGACLFFQPASGVHVRVATEATRGLRRCAPRVAMFGITNACNLRCAFCSRDTERASAWTVASAAEALRGLWRAGTLEVAYGGGEPFAFRGFAELVAELDATTSLAQHVTTNGTLIGKEMWRAYEGKLGQVRLSIYEGVEWRQAATVLAEAGQRWGANVLVDAAMLEGERPASWRLSRLLAEVAALGARDVSLLSYVGGEAALQLDEEGGRRLAEVIEAAPLSCRVSVCFGERVPVPLLAVGGAGDAGDCGAGRDFLSITPDRRVQSCSFQERSWPGETAEQILAAWRMQQPMLAQPSPRIGCARGLPVIAAPASSSASLSGRERALPPVSIWQGFSGNNSGECLMVASFHTVADAAAYLDELAPGWQKDGRYSAAWQQLFADEAVTVAAEREDDGSFNDSPSELVALGRVVVAEKYGLEPSFPELSALAWKRGARKVTHAFHLHGPATMLVAARARDAADRERLVERAAEMHAHVRARDERAARETQGTRKPAAMAEAHRVVALAHGELVIAAVPVFSGGRSGGIIDESLAPARDAALAWTAGRPFAVELYGGEIDEAELLAAKRRAGHAPAQVPRLWLAFWGADGERDAGTFARSLFSDERVTIAAGGVLVDPAPDRKRLAVLALRQGAIVHALDSERVSIQASVWYLQPPRRRGKPAERGRVVDVPHLQQVVGALLPAGSTLTVEPCEDGAPEVMVETSAPSAALRVLVHYAHSVEARLTVWMRERREDVVHAMLCRVMEDLEAGG